MRHDPRLDSDYRRRYPGTPERQPYRPWRDAEVDRRVGDYQVGGLEGFGAFSDESPNEHRHVERNPRSYERSFWQEPRGGRQRHDPVQDDRSSLYGRRGYGWPGPDSPEADRSQYDPQFHTRNMRYRLRGLIDHLRSDIRNIDEPQLDAMFETAAEVLSGLEKAFRDYERRNESAWRWRR